jgi:hypothetical protein
MATYDNDLCCDFGGRVTLADACRVLAWMRQVCPETVAWLECNSGGVLHPDNCENDDAFIFWVHQELCVSIGRPEGPTHGPDYAVWPGFVRDFYDAGWAACGNPWCPWDDGE